MPLFLHIWKDSYEKIESFAPFLHLFNVGTLCASYQVGAVSCMTGDPAILPACRMAGKVPSEHARSYAERSDILRHHDAGLGQEVCRIFGTVCVCCTRLGCARCPARRGSPRGPPPRSHAQTDCFGTIFRLPGTENVAAGHTAHSVGTWRVCTAAPREHSRQSATAPVGVPIRCGGPGGFLAFWGAS